MEPTHQIVLVLTILCLTPLAAQAPSAPVMVRDINATATAAISNPGSNPAGFAPRPAITYFGATDRATGNELWSTLGLSSTTRRVLDINPGPSSSNPAGFTLFQGAVYFAATTAANGRELWKTDGTANGTVLVKDFAAGQASGNPDAMIVLNNVLYVLLGTGGTGVSINTRESATGALEVWRSDGTTAGTTLVKRISSATGGGSSSQDFKEGLGALPVAVLGNAFVFPGLDTTNGAELWKSDGTTTGTVLLRDILPGSDSSNISGLTTFNNIVLFSAGSSTGDIELWKTDGTPAGTQLVKDINAGTRASSPLELTVFGGKVYFVATDQTAGRELWETDGTAAGTQMVQDIRPGATSSSIGQLVVFNNLLYFRANDGTTGVELWRSNGTANGTVLAVDLRAGTSSSSPNSLVASGTTLYFSANTGSGVELFKSDGTPAGTVLVKDINTTTPTASSSPSLLTAGALQVVVFRANDGVTGLEPWVTDGTAAGTFQLADINPANPNASAGSSPNFVTEFGDGVLFTANSGTVAGTTGNELWFSDGTANGTRLVRDINPGTASSSPAYLTFFRGKVYFRANDGANGIELWVTDGTTAGTRLVKDIRVGTASSAPIGFTDGAWARFVVMGDAFYFSANDGSGNELYRSDGTPQGTFQVMDIRPGTTGSNPNQMAAIGGRLYFNANDGSGAEPWTSDGTTAGTARLADLNAGTASSSASEFVAFGNRVVFRANGGAGNELFITDGTTAGTQLVKDINTTSATASSSPFGFVVLGNTVLFRANDGQTGNELWKSDGTAAGTVQVADIAPGAASSSPTYLQALGNKVYFRASGKDGTELYETDGTANGTVMTVDLDPFGNGNVLYVQRQGTRHLWFTATTNVFGSEVYRTDGTAAGTIRVGDVNPGDNMANPYYTTLAGGSIYFRADDGEHGLELWVVRLPGATAATTGDGCRAGGAPPRLAGLDPVLGGTTALTLSGGAPNAPGALVFAAPSTGVDLGTGCVFYIDVTTLYAPPMLFRTDGAGAFTTGPIPVPNVAALQGIDIGVQGGVDAPGTLPLGVGLTNGVWLVPGR